jgi:hypothetical protein
MAAYRTNKKRLRNTQAMMGALRGADHFVSSVETLIRRTQQMLDALDRAAASGEPVDLNTLPSLETMREALAPFEEEE